MLPTTTTATVLDSPQKKIQDLLAAARVQRDPKFSSKQYIRSAQSIINAGGTARVKGDMEGAFVSYLKATTIVLEVVPQNKDFDKLKTDPEYMKIKKEVNDLFSDTEKIKELLTAKYRSIQEVEASALATAAKAGRPKPPPRPSKPAFLSSSQHDGHAPIPAPSTVINSSFSAPGTPSSFYLPTVPQSTSSSPNPMGAPQGSMYMSMSVAPVNGMVVSSPLPTTLASYKPLQPTAYGSSSPNFRTYTISSAGTMVTSGPITSTLPQAVNSVPIPTVSGVGPTPQQPASLMPASRPTYTAMASSAAIANGGNGDIRESPDPTPTHSSGIQSTTSSSSESTNGKYPFPLSIKPQRVLDYMRQPTPPHLLLIDVRMQVQYKHARIKGAPIVNVEPPALRDGVSAKIIADQGLFNNPPSERKVFASRSDFALVIYYDQNSTTPQTSGPLCNLFRALHDLEFERPLQKRPVLLIGGFDAWLECAGMKWVEGQGVDDVARLEKASPPLSDVDDASSTAPQGDRQSRPGSTPIPVNYQPQNHAIFAKLSRGGGINRHDGEVILRNIGDMINRDDGPESMVNPRIGSSPSSLSNAAYPPRATPYTNTNAFSHPSSQPTFNNTSTATADPANTNGVYGMYPRGSQGASYLDNYNVSGGVINRNGTSPEKLHRRQTIYDSHWNNFGTAGRPYAQNTTAPPIPAKIPISGVSMSTTVGDSNTALGPALPSGMQAASTMRPPIPSRPMRPLPQPPGMNDLKDYTKFGSGFSKIGGSQLGKTGLTNLGNTCFMNSVIQCLIATPPLSRYFLDGSFKRHINIRNPMGTQGRLAEAFSDLIRNMWSGQSLVVSPTSFRYAIGGFAPQFKGTEQHDSQEFLSFLLDGLHEDLKLEPRLPPSGDGEGSEADEARMEALPEYEASEIAWQRYLRRDNSIVVNLFQGQFKNRLCCAKCGKTSTTYNAFMYLTLPIKAKTSGRQPQTLSSCLNSFVEPEVMEGDNAWNCPHCKKPRKATKQLTISRVPDVLLIHLKRFSSDGPFKNKIKAMVQYPIQDLDLTKYLPKGTEPAAIYDLYAVSNHSGEVSSGHYTACVRGETPSSWINFDDSRVSPCDKSVAVDNI
ncbi:ubiquitin-specific protease doa4 [Dissophora ornata]|nr:ubiquitin-specific protease doa4 [Dissophora ornata]